MVAEPRRPGYPVRRAEAQPFMSEPIPGPIGPYQPTELVASGAHATVWKAQGPQGVVALKVARISV